MTVIKGLRKGRERKLGVAKCEKKTALFHSSDKIMRHTHTWKIDESVYNTWTSIVLYFL